MPFVVPDQAKELFLVFFSEQAKLLHLYTNDHIPAEGDREEDYQEARGSQYSPKVLSADKWDFATSGPIIEHPEQEWLLREDSDNIYGYYITRSDGFLLMAERFPDGPYLTKGPGQAMIRVSLRFSLGKSEDEEE